MNSFNGEFRKIAGPEIQETIFLGAVAMIFGTIMSQKYRRQHDFPMHKRTCFFSGRKLRTNAYSIKPPAGYLDTLGSILIFVQYLDVAEACESAPLSTCLTYPGTPAMQD